MSRTHSRILTVGRLLSIWAAIATLLLCGGCLLPGEGSRQLTFEPESRKIQYLYDFDRAYAAPSADGGYDLVLTSGFKVRSARSVERLYPAAVPATPDEQNWFGTKQG